MRTENFLQEMQNAVQEIKGTEGDFSGRDFARVVEMSIIAFVNMTEKQKKGVLNDIEHPWTHDFLKERAPKWYSKFVTNIDDSVEYFAR